MLAEEMKCLTAVHLNVVFIPVPPSFTMRPSSQKVRVGDDVKLDCVSAGDPVPSQKWNKDGRLVVLGMVNALKLQTLYSLCSQMNYWFSGLYVTKYLSEQQTGRTLIRLLLQKQSDLGLHSLSRPYYRVPTQPGKREKSGN